MRVHTPCDRITDPAQLRWEQKRRSQGVCGASGVPHTPLPPAPGELFPPAWMRNHTLFPRLAQPPPEAADAMVTMITGIYGEPALVRPSTMPFSPHKRQRPQVQSYRWGAPRGARCHQPAWGHGAQTPDHSEAQGLQCVQASFQERSLNKPLFLHDAFLIWAFIC